MQDDLETATTPHFSSETSANVPDQASGKPPGIGEGIGPLTGSRTGKALIDTTRPFASEDRARSWWYLLSSYALWLAALVLVASPLLPTPARLAVSILDGLLVVRVFMLYHDHLHGAVLKDSAVAAFLLRIYGHFVMAAPRVWRQSHNYHHAHTAKIAGSHIGSFMLITTDMWKLATPRQRLFYRTMRHPVTIALGVFTLFLYGMCIAPFLREPRRGAESIVSLALHGLYAYLLIHFLGVDAWLYAVLLPLGVACSAGGYLFYAQHNFPGMHIAPRSSWDYTRAALESSSFMRTGAVMGWFTGNIGYHHVHHLNPSIPFYRLPEAMAAVPELQHPVETSLAPPDVLACFRLKLWDPVQNKMVGYPVN